MSSQMATAMPSLPFRAEREGIRCDSDGEDEAG